MAIARSVAAFCARWKSGLVAACMAWRRSEGSRSACASSGLLSVSWRSCGFCSIIMRMSSGLLSSPCSGVTAVGASVARSKHQIVRGHTARDDSYYSKRKGRGHALAPDLHRRRVHHLPHHCRIGHELLGRHAASAHASHTPESAQPALAAKAAQQAEGICWRGASRGSSHSGRGLCRCCGASSRRRGRRSGFGVVARRRTGAHQVQRVAALAAWTQRGGGAPRSTPGGTNSRSCQPCLKRALAVRLATSAVAPLRPYRTTRVSCHP